MHSEKERIQDTEDTRQKTEDRMADLPTSGRENRKPVPDYLGPILFVPLLLCAFVPSKASPAWTNYAKRTQFSKSQIDLSYCHTKDYGSKIALDTW